MTDVGSVPFVITVQTDLIMVETTVVVKLPKLVLLFVQQFDGCPHFLRLGHEGKGLGVDKIPPKLLKWGAPILIPVLTKLFNKCLLGGIYPDSLKIARVKPIFKGGIKNQIPSYRPISILTQINRIFEKILRDSLYDFMKDKLYRKQFGFRPKNSTEHPVLDMKEVILENSSKKLVSCILFLDLKKAFDTVSHQILLKKLDYYSVKRVALKLFESYLDRKQLDSY